MALCHSFLPPHLEPPTPLCPQQHHAFPFPQPYPCSPVSPAHHRFPPTHPQKLASNPASLQVTWDTAACDWKNGLCGVFLSYWTPDSTAVLPLWSFSGAVCLVFLMVAKIFFQGLYWQPFLASALYWQSVNSLTVGNPRIWTDPTSDRFFCPNEGSVLLGKGEMRQRKNRPLLYPLHDVQIKPI